MSRPLKYRKTDKYTEICLQPSKESSFTVLNIIFCRPIEITLFSDEVEALKLCNMYDLSQAEIAKKMKISQPTIARILKKAYKKVTRAIVEGKAIRIKNIHHSNTEKIKLGLGTPAPVSAMERFEDGKHKKNC
ncbi:DUF134 domain-containing protein [Candidatus Dependentiae bacterium]